MDHRLLGIGTAVALLLSSAGGSKAESGADLFLNLLGGVMAANQVQAASEAWDRLPDTKRYCLERGLATQNASISSVIRSGVSPSDARLAHLSAQCQKFEPSALKSGFACFIEDEGGMRAPSICSQRFASVGGQVLDTTTAIDLFFTNGDFALTEVEDENAKAARYQRREQQERMDAALETRAELEAAIDGVRARKLDVEKRILFGTPADLKQEADRLAGKFAELTESAEAPRSAGVELDIPIGPTFDCRKAQLPVEKAICGSDELKRLDVEVYQPVYLLRHVFPDRREALKRESIAFSKQTQKRCKLEGQPSNAAVRKAVPCLVEAYQRQRDIWRQAARADTTGNASEELARSVDEHVRLQAALQSAGYLSATDPIDGVYGGGTRAAVSQFQMQQGLPGDGILSNLTADRLEQVGSFSAIDSARGEAALEGLDDLYRDYARLAVRFDAVEAERKRREDLEGKIAFATAFVRQALDAELPADLRGRLQRFLDAVKGPATLGDDDLVRLAAEFDALQPTAESAIAVAKATTPKTSFIVLGPLDDVLVLYNDTGKAPSIVKNLRGELVFEGGKATGCQAGKGFADVAVQREVNRRLAAWQQALTFPLQACNLVDLNAYDVLLLERGEFLKQKSADAISLLDAVQAGDFVQLAHITRSEVQGSVQAEAVRVLDVEIGVEKGTRKGYGIIVLPVTGSGVVCNAASDDVEAHATLVEPYAERIGEEILQETTFVDMSVDAAFVAVKRGQCGAIYAAANDLKDITLALKRDEIDFRFLPIWIDPAQLEQSRKAIDEAAAEEARQEAERSRQVDDEERLAAAKASDAQEVRKRRETELRAEYGDVARAFEGEIRTEIKRFVELDGDSTMAEKYPGLAAWYLQQLRDKWELVTVETTLLDYGTAEFKGRTLEAGFATTWIRIRNRILGEYQDSCFVTGFIADAEFAMAREPLELICDEADQPLLKYKQARSFASRWVP